MLTCIAVVCAKGQYDKIMHNERLIDDTVLVEQRLREMAAGLIEAIDQEVERRRRRGQPIHVSDNGRVINLQEVHGID